MMFLLLLLLPCSLQAVDVINSDVKDDFVVRLGGLFTIYHRGQDETCDTTKIFGSSVQWLEMTMYTIERINADVTMLPGIKLVLEPFHDCLVDTRALKRIVERYLSRIESESRNDTYWAVIGPETSEVSVPTAKLLGLFHIPQISSSATSPILSDKQRFPYFFRTAPSDNFQIAAMIQIIQHNGWEFVSFVYEDNDYGTQAFNAFKNQTQGSSLCVAAEVKLPRSPTEGQISAEVERLAAEKANVVVVFATEYNIALMLKHVISKGLASRFQWIGSDTWNGIQTNDLLAFLKNDSFYEPLNEVLDGAISLAWHSLADEKFESYIRTMTLASQHNPYFREYLAFLYKCSLNANDSSKPLCASNLTLPRDQSTNLMLQTAANAVLSFAHALHNAQQLLCEHPTDRVCERLASLPGSELRGFLRNVSFVDTNSQTFSFDEFQDGPAHYDIWRYDGKHNHSWGRIGQYNNGEATFTPGLEPLGRGQITSVCGVECGADEYMSFQARTCCWICIECSKDSVVRFNNSAAKNVSYCYECPKQLYANKITGSCDPVPLSYLSFSERWAWGVAGVSCVGLILTLLTVATYLWYWGSALVKASGRELSSVILVGLTLAFMTSFFFCFKPTPALCAFRRFSTGLSFTLIYSAVLVKTIRISLIFNTLGKKLVRDYKRMLRPLPQIVITVILTSIEVFLLATWLAMLPPVVSTTRSASIDEVPVDFADCEGLRDHVLLIGISYPILLVLICSVYAFRIRKVPAGFNEAKHIGFAVYTTLVIWLAQVSIYLANSSTDVVLRDAIYCLGLSLNGLIILFAIFGPKVYIVIFRPEKNNHRMVMGPQSSRVRSLSSPSAPPPEVTSRKSLPQCNTNSNNDTWWKRNLSLDVTIGHSPSNQIQQTTAVVTSQNGLSRNETSEYSDDVSVTSDNSHQWKVDFMRSYDAIAKSSVSSLNHDDVIIDTSSSKVFREESFPKTVCEKMFNNNSLRRLKVHAGFKGHSGVKGQVNPAFQSDNLVLRTRSLPKRGQGFRSNDVTRNRSMMTSHKFE